MAAAVTRPRHGGSGEALGSVRGAGAAAFAARFGISVKALRVYEARGLITPDRTLADWRVYGPAEAERLHAILALRQLGLSLKQIADLVAGRQTGLDGVLALQQAALEAQARSTRLALKAVAAARTRLARGETLSVDTLANLVRRQTMSTQMEWTPELEALSRRIYTADQHEAFARRKTEIPEAEMQALSERWDEIFADIDRLGPDAATSEEGLAVGRRAVSLLWGFFGGDKALWNASARFWQEGFKDPQVRPQLPMDQGQWAWLGKAMQVLKDRGELEPVA